ncbi:MAG: signal peptidase I [Mollicutes bacterium]|nr:signal peptidase I [Mollicutes bacterium]
MKKNILSVYIIEIITFFCIIIFYKVLSPGKYTISMGIYFFILSIIMLIRFGFMKDNNYIKPSVIRIIIAVLMAYFIIIYGLGIITGFSQGLSSFTKDIILNGILYDIVIITSQEIIRHIICKNAQNNKKPIIIYTLLLIFVSILMQASSYSFDSREGIFIFFSVVLIPIVAEHLLCSYINVNVGLAPSVIYRLVITLYVYFLPILPNLGNYLTAVVNIFLPYSAYAFSRRMIKYSEKSEYYGKSLSFKIVTIPTMVILIIIICLISGVLRYKMLAVASDSMIPVFYRGDAIIYDKKGVNKLKKGDVIAFKRDKIIVTHRIMEIKNTNNKQAFITKGDANKNNDEYIVLKEDVVGKVNVVLKYIGYPTIWVREVFE